MVKRTFDLICSFLGLLLLSPIFAAVAAAIKRDSEGPVFYAGKRVGRNGEPFKILKFRTMRETPEAHQGPRITGKGDARVTNLGRLLRDSKLNELPQLVNVLKGEMSLVGPRPEDPSFVKHYNKDQLEVLSVRPGITSLASVMYAGEESMLSGADVAEKYMRNILPDKLRLDLLYVRHRSFLLDLDILFRTLLIFIPRFRRATVGAEDILLGPFRALRRLVSWFTIDAATAFIAVGLSGILWRAAGPLDLGPGRAFVVALGMASLFTGVNMLMGAQRVQWRYASASEATGVVLSVAIATGLVLILNHRILNPTLPPEMLIVSGTFALAGFLGVRYRRRLVRGLGDVLASLHSPVESTRERVLLVGAGDTGQLTLWLLHTGFSGKAFQVVGIVDDDVEKLGTLIHRVPVIALCDRVPEIAQEHNIGLIVFAIRNIDRQRRNEILHMCSSTEARTVIAPDILTFLNAGRDSGSDYVDQQMMATLPGLDPENEAFASHLAHHIHDLATDARNGDLGQLCERLLALDAILSANGGSLLDQQDVPVQAVEEEPDSAISA